MYKSYTTLDETEIHTARIRAQSITTSSRRRFPHNLGRARSRLGADASQHPAPLITTAVRFPLAVCPSVFAATNQPKAWAADHRFARCALAQMQLVGSGKVDDESR